MVGCASCSHGSTAGRPPAGQFAEHLERRDWRHQRLCSVRSFGRRRRGVLDTQGEARSSCCLTTTSMSMGNRKREVQASRTEWTLEMAADEPRGRVNLRPECSEALDTHDQRRSGANAHLPVTRSKGLPGLSEE